MPTPYSVDWKPLFLAALREMPVIRHGCEAAGVNRSTAWRARQTDEEFAKAWDDAMADGIDRAEQEALRRGVFGYEEPVVYQGQLTPRMAPVVDAEGNPAMDELTGTQKWAVVRDATGQPVHLTVRKHSDALLALVLKGRRKEVYADRTELAGVAGQPLQVDQTVRAARVAQLLDIARKRSATSNDFGDLA